jgi:hypothetical protein
MRTMSANRYLSHVPMTTGGYGREEVERLYRCHVIPRRPPDTSVQLVSRTLVARRERSAPLA